MKKCNVCKQNIDKQNPGFPKRLVCPFGSGQVTESTIHVECLTCAEERYTSLIKMEEEIGWKGDDKGRPSRILRNVIDSFGDEE